MKKILFIGVLVVAGISLAGCDATNKLNKKVTNLAKDKIVEKVDEAQKQVSDKVEEKTDKLQNIMKLGKPQKCTWANEDGSTGTIYTDGHERTYVEAKDTITADGKKGNVYSIINKDMTYTWSSTSSKGMKIKTDLSKLKERADATDTDESNMPGDNESDDAIKMLESASNHKCHVWLVNPKMFTPPNNIQFVDLSNLTNAFLGKGENSKADLKALCEFAKDEAEKADCLKNMEKMGNAGEALNNKLNK